MHCLIAYLRLLHVSLDIAAAQNLPFLARLRRHSHQILGSSEAKEQGEPLKHVCKASACALQSISLDLQRA